MDLHLTIQQQITILMDRHQIVGLEFRQHDDGKRRERACFATPEAARAFKQVGYGGWVLGRYWYDHTWTPSAVIRDCPESGEMY